nr:hypothetical transcript [Hymenolepis microstoma]
MHISNGPEVTSVEHSHERTAIQTDNPDQQKNLSWHCDFPSDRTTHLVILILLGLSPFRQLSLFVHSYSHRMYQETDFGVYARNVALFSYPYDVTPYFHPYDVVSFVPLRCRFLLPPQGSNTRTHGDASTGKHTAGRF